VANSQFRGLELVARRLVKMPGASPPDSEQLNLFHPWCYVVIEDPWGGRSARSLTKVAEQYSFDATPPWGLRE